MLKICAVIRAKAGLTREEFLYYWQTEHPEVVCNLPGVRRYVQNVPVEHAKPWPFDAVAEVYFDSMKDIALAFSSPQADVMREHEKLFISDMQWVITESFEMPVGDVPADCTSSEPV